MAKTSGKRKKSFRVHFSKNTRSQKLLNSYFSQNNNRSSRADLLRSVAIGGVLLVLIAALAQLDLVRAAGSITGRVFQDFNGNGFYNATGGSASAPTAIDRGVANITVTAFDSSGAQRGAATTDADGNYTLAATGSGPYRIEFTNLPAGFEPSAKSKSSVGAGTATDAGSTVQFVPDGATANVNLAINRPADFCQDNPEVCATLYGFGTQSDPAIFTILYNSGSTRTTGGSPFADFVAPTQNELTRTGQVGTTFGMAYSRTARKIYAAAFFKKHSALGPGGTGAIYQVDRNNNNQVSVLANLNSIFGANTAGADPRAGVAADYDYDTDYGNDANNKNKTWDAVGKIALGGMAISTDETKLYVVNLANRNLYEIPLNETPSSANIRRVAFPTPTFGAPDTAFNCPAADVRPFAVTYRANKVYVGAVCSAESTNLKANLRVYIYGVDPAASTLAFDAAPVFKERLDYTRLEVDPGAAAAWNAWSPTFNSLNTTGIFVYPQPMLTDFAFNNGNLILALRDRNGDQTGYQTLDDPNNTARRSKGITAGDIIRACGAFGAWTLENNGRCGGTGSAPQGTNEGPGGAEFYYQDNYHPNGNPHDEVALGGVLQLPGYANLMATIFDPIYVPDEDIFDAGGFRWLNNTSGAQERGFLAYDRSGDFGKSNGIGGTLPAMCDLAPLQIGNRVWLDQNGNGVQDGNGTNGASEAGISGVAVELWEDTNGDNAADTSVATTNTDANGEYYFGESVCQDTTLSAQVNASENDAEEDSNGATTITGGSLDLAWNGSTTTPLKNTVGLRFTNLNIPRGATITSANIQFATNNARNTTAVNLLIEGENTGNATTFAAATNNVTNRVRTSANVAWSNLPAWSGELSNAAQRTPALNQIVQEIVNRSDWTSNNNSMAFILSDNNSTNQASRSGYSFNSDPNGAPVLTVTYRTNCGYKIKQNRKYEVRIPRSNFNAGQPLSGKFLTAANTATQAGTVDNSDSDGINIFNPTGASGVVPVAEIVTGGAGANNHNIDFGFSNSAGSDVYSLGNRVWFDTNNNGRIETAEKGAGSIGVDIYADANADGAPDSATTAAASATTDANGYYRFDNLAAGNYVVCVKAANFNGAFGGYRNTAGSSFAEIDSDATNASENGVDARATSGACSGGTLSQTIVLGPGVSEPVGEIDLAAPDAVDARANMTVDFGYYRLSLCGTVWTESDDNGILNNGEAGRNNVRVRLYNASNNEILTGADGVLGTADDNTNGVLTGANGQAAGGYCFRGLAPGDYRVRISALGGRRSSKFGGGSIDVSNDPDDNVDNDDNGLAATGFATPTIESQIVTLTPGALQTKLNNTVTYTTGSTDDPTVDFGLVGTATAVELQSFIAVVYNDGVLLEWQTGFESGNLGFRIIREQNGRREIVNRDIIAGSAFIGGANLEMQSNFEYKWLDRDGTENAVYYLEDVEASGRTNVSPAAEQKLAQDESAPRIANARSFGESNRDGIGAQIEKPLSLEKPVFKANVKKAKGFASSANQFANEAAVKIAVNADGWQKVARAALVAAGLPETADLNALQLFADNREQALRVNTDGSIEFYGKGLDTNETDSRVYWLVWNRAVGKRINIVDAGKAENAQVGSFTSVVEKRDRTIYAPSVLNGERENFFGGYVWSSELQKTVTLNNLVAGNAALEIDLQGFTANQHQVAVKVNGNSIGFAELNGTQRNTFRFDLPANVLRAGANEIALQETNGDGSVSLLEAVRVSYQKRTTAENGKLQFVAAANAPILINNFASRAVRVFDATDAENVAEIAVKAVKSDYGFAVAVPAAANNRLLVAFDARAALNAPANVAANRASDWRNLKDGAQFVIVAHPDFEAAANRLAEARRAGGLSTVVVNVEDIFDEFSGGATSANAIAEFLRGAAATWKTKPQYLLLFGDASADARNFLNRAANNFVPTRLVDTAKMETSSDDALTDFNNDGIADISTGRFAVHSSAEADAVVNKLLAYERTPIRGKQRGALFIADNGFEDSNREFAGAMQNLMPVESINRQDGSADEVRARILNNVNNGARVVTFTGHGSQRAWTSGNLFKADDAANLTNGNRLSFFVNLTCLTGSFADPVADSLGESLLNVENGGAMAVWASSGMTTEDEQKPMATTIFANFQQFAGMRLGDAVRSAKQTTENADVRRTWTLLGDPTMRLR